MGKHVIVGAGQVGHHLAGILAERGDEVVMVSRSGNGPGTATKVAADAGDADRLTSIAQGADVIYNCANPPYHRWPQEWPPIARALLGAAQANGAVLVTLSNLYIYGPVDRPMTEDLPLASNGVKGQVRAGMWAEASAAHEAGRVRITEVRASDYFGPGVRDQGFVGERFVPPLLAGKRVPYLHDLDIEHSWTYVPDVAHALAIAGTDERAWGRAWHVPTGPPLSARALADLVCSVAGAPAPRLRRLPAWVLDAAALGSPLMRELKETRYQFQRPFVLDSSAFESAFGVKPTPADVAAEATVRWWREQLQGPVSSRTASSGSSR